MNRYDLTDFEWSVIEPSLPNKPRGVPRVDDRRVLNGMTWVLRSGAPRRDLPERSGPYTTCYDPFDRRGTKGIWYRLMDSSSVRVHQVAAGSERGSGSLRGSFPRRADDEDPRRGHRALRARPARRQRPAAPFRVEPRPSP